MIDTITEDVLRVTATRIVGPAGERKLEEKCQSKEISVAELAAFFNTRLPQKDRERVFDAVLTVLLRPDVPMVSLEAVGGMIGIVAAEIIVTAGLAEAKALVVSELAQGKKLTQTTLWSRHMKGGSFDTRHALLSVTRHDSYDLFDCAEDPARPERERECAIDYLHDRLARAKERKMSPAEITRFGAILRNLSMEQFDRRHPVYKHAELIPAWVQCDADGALTAMEKLFDATQVFNPALLYQLKKVRRKGSGLERWRQLIQRMTKARVRDCAGIGGLSGAAAKVDSSHLRDARYADCAADAGPDHCARWRRRPYGHSLKGARQRQTEAPT